MGMFDYFKQAGEASVDMARPPRQPNRAAIKAYVDELAAAKIDDAKFDDIFRRLSEDRTIAALDVVAIANGYAIIGERPTSKKNALEKIRKRFVELVRAEAKVLAAAKVRPW